MVASFVDKAVTKSYVRLPGSGIDKEARASFCDLARGSSLAASISVPQPAGVPRPTQKRPRAEEPTSEPSKRPRLETPPQNTTRPSVISKHVPVTNPGIVQAQLRNSSSLPSPNASNNQVGAPIQKPTKYIIISNTEQDIKKLKEQNDTLRTENASLQKQISLFKQIFRDPKKHESFLRRFLPQES